MYEQILIDSGAFARIAWEVQYPTRGTYEPVTESPVLDFGVNYIKAMSRILGSFASEDTDVILCMDPQDSRTLFRHQIVNEYYSEYLWVAKKEGEEREYLCTFDGKYIILQWDTINNNLRAIKCTGKKAKEYLAAGFEWIDRSSLSLATQEAIDLKVRPNYKQGRTWPYDKFINKESFNELRWSVAWNVANLLGLWVFEDPKLEADDLIYRAVKANNKKTLILTVDSDLNQVLLERDNIDIYNLGTRRVLSKTQDQVKHELWTKLLLGETKVGSDNITATVSKKRGTPMSAKPVDKFARELVALKTGEERMEAVNFTVHEMTFQKNMQLMLLSQAPEPTTEVVRNVDTGVSFEDMHTSQAEVDLWLTQARSAKLTKQTKDIGDGQTEVTFVETPKEG